MAELFTNLGTTTVSSGGTTAPAAGTSETWTVASSAGFPTASSVSGSVFRVVENDSIRQSEIILVTNVSGTTWTVTRGAEGTTPVAHPINMTIVQTVTSNIMQGWEDKLGLRASVGLTGGGIVTYDASSNLSWSARFIFISQAKGTNGPTAGYWDVTVPPNGTVIPGVAGASSVTAGVAGVPMGTWSALWYILPIGGASASVPANFRIVNYTAGDFTPPDEWVLIAVQNGDSGAVRVANGLTLMPGSSAPVGSVTNTPILIPFHLGGSIPVAIAKPKFLATRTVVIVGARYYLEAGTMTPAIYVNGVNTAQGSSIVGVASGTWAMSFTLNAGDRLQLGATAADASSAELSVTLEGFAR